MVILITGASHTGKTLLAQRLLEKLRYPYLSIDHLKMGLIRSGNTALTPADDDKLTGYLWPIVSEMIKTAIENRQDLVVEGCYVPADWRSAFDGDYLKSIRFICLAMTDEYIDGHIDDIRSHACVIENRLYDHIDADALKAENRAYIRAFGDDVTVIDEDYESVIRDVLEKF